MGDLTGYSQLAANATDLDLMGLSSIKVTVDQVNGLNISNGSYDVVDAAGPIEDNIAEIDDAQSVYSDDILTLTVAEHKQLDDEDTDIATGYRIVDEAANIEAAAAEPATYQVYGTDSAFFGAESETFGAFKLSGVEGFFEFDLMVEEGGSPTQPVFQYGDFLVEATNIGAGSFDLRVVDLTGDTGPAMVATGLTTGEDHVTSIAYDAPGFRDQMILINVDRGGVSQISTAGHPRAEGVFFGAEVIAADSDSDGTYEGSEVSSYQTADTVTVSNLELIEGTRPVPLEMTREGGWGLERAGYTFYTTDGAAVGIPAASSVNEVLPPAGRTVTELTVSHSLIGAIEIVSSDVAPTLTLDQLGLLHPILTGDINVADTASEIEAELASGYSMLLGGAGTIRLPTAWSI